MHSQFQRLNEVNIYTKTGLPVIAALDDMHWNIWDNDSWSSKH